MQYKKEVMKLSELEKMGFPREWLFKVYREGTKSIAWKMSNAINSPILFDTYELEKYRKAYTNNRNFE